MKQLLVLWFMLVQVGSMTWVNPEFVVSVNAESNKRTAIDLATPGVITVYSEWSIDKVIEVLKKAFE